MTSDQPSTRDLLVAAALDEFNEQGFYGTDTNRIARRAGFAPQTFYRWFDNKTTIFLAAYAFWQEIEASELTELLEQRAGAMAMADSLVRHHRYYRVFRRSLRVLAAEDAEVRRARAEGRATQLEKVRMAAGRQALAQELSALRLLQVERLCDALAEDELADLGVADTVAQREIATLLSQLLAL